MEWRRMKMKVNLASQTQSRSVADSLEMLSHDLKLHKFYNCDATIGFIRIFDALFDVFNSRNVFSNSNKGPLSRANFDYWRPLFESSFYYISELKTNSGQKLIMQGSNYIIWEKKKVRRFKGAEFEVFSPISSISKISNL
uniref:THAP domaincontaining protein 9like [Ciona intestinalis] n=1 Tax=Lepeophtheirus salmonis TaxID=72036 RepID=A0A0K2UVP5_LEPSM